jgi:hypothetical protein
MADAPVSLPIPAERRDEPAADEGKMHNTVVSFGYQVYKINSPTVSTVFPSHLVVRLQQLVTSCIK